MLSIGYVFDMAAIEGKQTLSAQGLADRRELEQAGCNVVRIETGPRRRIGYGPVLQSVLEFVGPGDQILVMRADQIASSTSAILSMIHALQTRDVDLQILESGLSTKGPAGETLIKTLEAISSLEGSSFRRNYANGIRGLRSCTDTDEIMAMKAKGMAATQIANTLGVSRMTVWRKLKQAAVAGT